MGSEGKATEICENGDFGLAGTVDQGFTTNDSGVGAKLGSIYDLVGRSGHS